MEITKGVIGNFRVASVSIGPGNDRRDKADIEFLLMHDLSGYRVRGFVTMTCNDRLVARSSPEKGLSMSDPARKVARKLMKEVCRCMMREYSDV